MTLTRQQHEVLDALVQADSSRGLTSGEVCAALGWSSDADIQLVLQALIALGLVEKREQIDEFWPSGRPAEAIPLGGGQIRSRARYCATREGLALYEHG